MTVYIPDDLYAEVKADPELNASAICQTALRRELDNRKNLTRVVLFDANRGATVAFRGRKLELTSRQHHAIFRSVREQATMRQLGDFVIAVDPQEREPEPESESHDQPRSRNDPRRALQADVATVRTHDMYITAKGKIAAYNTSTRALNVYDGLADLYAHFPAAFVKIVADELGDDVPPDPNIIELDI